MKWQDYTVVEATLTELIESRGSAVAVWSL